MGYWAIRRCFVRNSVFCLEVEAVGSSFDALLGSMSKQKLNDQVFA